MSQNAATLTFDTWTGKTLYVKQIILTEEGLANQTFYFNENTNILVYKEKIDDQMTITREFEKELQFINNLVLSNFTVNPAAAVTLTVIGYLQY